MSVYPGSALASYAPGSTDVHEAHIDGSANANLQPCRIPAAYIYAAQVRPIGSAGGQLTGTYPSPVIAPLAVAATNVVDYSIPLTKLGTGITPAKFSAPYFRFERATTNVTFNGSAALNVTLGSSVTIDHPPAFRPGSLDVTAPVFLARADAILPNGKVLKGTDPVSVTFDDNDMTAEVGVSGLRAPSTPLAPDGGTAAILLGASSRVESGSRSAIAISGSGARIHAGSVNTIAIGNDTRIQGGGAVAIGNGALVSGHQGVAIGAGTEAGTAGVAIGRGATARGVASVSLGAGATHRGRQPTVTIGPVWVNPQTPVGALPPRELIWDPTEVRCASRREWRHTVFTTLEGRKRGYESLVTGTDPENGGSIIVRRYIYVPPHTCTTGRITVSTRRHLDYCAIVYTFENLLIKRFNSGPVKLMMRDNYRMVDQDRYVLRKQYWDNTKSPSVGGSRYFSACTLRTDANYPDYLVLDFRTPDLSPYRVDADIAVYALQMIAKILLNAFNYVMMLVPYVGPTISAYLKTALYASTAFSAAAKLSTMAARAAQAARFSERVRLAGARAEQWAQLASKSLTIAREGILILRDKANSYITPVAATASNLGRVAGYPSQFVDYFNYTNDFLYVTGISDGVNLYDPGPDSYREIGEPTITDDYDPSDNVRLLWEKYYQGLAGKPPEAPNAGQFVTDLVIGFFWSDPFRGHTPLSLKKQPRAPPDSYLFWVTIHASWDYGHDEV